VADAWVLSVWQTDQHVPVVSTPIGEPLLPLSLFHMNRVHAGRGGGGARSLAWPMWPGCLRQFGRPHPIAARQSKKEEREGGREREGEQRGRSIATEAAVRWAGARQRKGEQGSGARQGPDGVARWRPRSPRLPWRGRGRARLRQRQQLEARRVVRGGSCLHLATTVAPASSRTRLRAE
jgi:hypothetical protein